MSQNTNHYMATCGDTMVRKFCELFLLGVDIPQSEKNIVRALLLLSALLSSPFYLISLLLNLRHPRLLQRRGVTNRGIG